MITLQLKTRWMVTGGFVVLYFDNKVDKLRLNVPRIDLSPICDFHNYKLFIDDFVYSQGRPYYIITNMQLTASSKQVFECINNSSTEIFDQQKESVLEMLDSIIPQAIF